MRAELCYIGLGSNLGDPALHLDGALAALRRLSSDGQVSRSGLYRSEPLGPPGQPDYLNAVVRFGTTLPPGALLAALQRIENEHGRTREVRWGMRTLDLDILLYGGEVIRSPGLNVPHPRIAERLFVLRPLLDLDPDLAVPGLGAARDLVRRCPALRLEPVSWDICTPSG